MDPVTIFTDPKAYTDPESWHAVAARLRREDPVARIEVDGFDPFWAVTRHADVIEIERQPDRFPNTIGSVLAPSALKPENGGPQIPFKTLIHMDGAQHRAYRSLTNDWFKPGALKRTLEPRVEQLAKKYVDRMAELGGACDFALDVARYYPLQVIMSVLGVPESDEPLMLDLTQKLFGADDPDFGVGSDLEKRLAVMMQLVGYFQRMTADRRARPGDDLASVIANGIVDGAALPDLETLGYYIIVATAGHDTTSSTLAGGLEALARRPGQLRALQEDPTGIDNAVEEMIRWVTPVRHFLRYAQEDSVLRGRTIAKGDGLLMSYLSANRDEEVFDDPFAFDIARANASSHLAFGTGVHFCLGANLARLELRAFFRELLPRLESIELAGPSEYTAATFVGAPKRVPIRYRLRA
ncbi:MAG TPA: cytochrome P450 [Myxococcota bacterium]|jgi:cytochrome P450|nr:cytochrome P450 [Myxococcota bacterium]